ncbi:MAG TPA: TetR/AcrR family transcriptional regulator [Parvularculaceae bacterium]|nr:TetR/AcrR family transcriptional regulator [Parvularculaceae bacterium]
MDMKTTMTGSRDEIIVTLYDLFRRAGYDAVSIADISDATGLGKSSLYHHFPGGKPDMAEAVADFARRHMRDHVFAPLAADAPLKKKLAAMMKTVAEMYEGGGAPCLIASMMISPTASPKAVRTVRAIVADWLDALAGALRDDGFTAGEAKARATAAIIAIQGALVVARALGDKKAFAAALKTAELELLA